MGYLLFHRQKQRFVVVQGVLQSVLCAKPVSEGFVEDRQKAVIFEKGGLGIEDRRFLRSQRGGEPLLSV